MTLSGGLCLGKHPPTLPGETEEAEVVELSDAEVPDLWVVNVLTHVVPLHRSEWSTLAGRDLSGDCALMGQNAS